MTTAYTTLLGLALPVQGELTGTWGTTVNNSITQSLDDAVAGTATASVTSGDWTLTDTGSGAPNQARCAILIATGTPGVSRNIIAPARSKGYFVVNQSDAAVVLKGASTTGISIPTNKSALVVWNGSDFVTAVSPSSSGTVTTLSVVSANGFTGTVANPTSTPAITLTTSISGVLKGNGTAISAASSGTDFSAGTSALATGILKSTTSTGALSIAVAGTDYQTAQSVTGMVKSSGTTRSAATAGTDYVAPGGALGTPSSGTLSSCTVDGTDAVGFRNIPVNSQSAAYTAVLADSGKCILHPSTDANARTFTIPANASVAYPIGTAISFVNMTSQVVSIAITSDTMYLAGTGTTGTRSLAIYGTATALKINSTTWIISGAGLT